MENIDTLIHSNGNGNGNAAATNDPAAGERYSRPDRGTVADEAGPTLSFSPVIPTAASAARGWEADLLTRNRDRHGNRLPWFYSYNIPTIDATPLRALRWRRSSTTFAKRSRSSRARWNTSTIENSSVPTGICWRCATARRAW